MSFFNNPLTKMSDEALIEKYIDKQKKDYGKEDSKLYKEILRRISNTPNINKKYLKKIIDDSKDPSVRIIIGSLQDKLTHTYKENYEAMLHVAQDQKNYLKKKYTNLKEKINQNPNNYQRTPNYYRSKNTWDLTNTFPDFNTIIDFKNKNENFNPHNYLKNLNILGELKEECLLLFDQIRTVQKEIDRLSFAENQGKSKLTSFDYRDKIIAACNFLTKERNEEKKTTNLDIILKDNNSTTRVFKKIVHAVFSALITGAGVTIACMIHSKETRGHYKFLESQGYDLKNSVEQIEKNLEIKHKN